MKSLSRFAVIGAFAAAALSGCHDAAAPVVTPAAVVLSTGADQNGTVGQKVAVAPLFVVTDASGNPLQGVPVSVAVGSGGGTLTDAPSRSSTTTSVGVWTLGPAVGTQKLVVTVPGVAPLFITAHAAPGAPARLVALTATTIAARVGEAATPAPSARVVDAFSNPVPNVAFTVSAVGGAAGASAVANDQGVVTVADWRFGTAVGQNILTLAAGAATLSFVANLAAGDPSDIVLDGVPQRAFAGTTLGASSLRVVDKYGNTIPTSSASLSVTGGGGSLAARRRQAARTARCRSRRGRSDAARRRNRSTSAPARSRRT